MLFIKQLILIRLFFICIIYLKCHTSMIDWCHDLSIDITIYQ